MATAAEAEDTEVDGGGGVGLIDADELQEYYWLDNILCANPKKEPK